MEPVMLGRADSAVGEVALRRRGPVLELVVDGVFAMDTVDPATERTMAGASLADHPAPRRVLVGGLGLGFTARAVLEDARVERVDVVELAEPLVRWARAGLAPELAGIEDGDRCRFHVADVADVLHGHGGLTGPWDVVLLDVDNGPGFLVHPANARLYDRDGVQRAYDRLAPAGVLVVWSSHRAPDLLETMRAVADSRGGVATESVHEVTRDGRTFDYALYSLTR